MNTTEYAGFWVRLGAGIIDTIIFMIVAGVPLTLIYGVEYWKYEILIYGFWDIFLSFIFPLIATIWFWLRFLATPGKMALKLKIVDARTGNRLSLGQSLGRYFAYILSMIPLGLGFIWIGIDKKKQGWHDKLANTVVIKSNDTVPVEFESNA